MGMSIDESISWITESILNMRKSQLCISDKFALKTALDIMRKYKKIVKILNWREYDVDPNYHTNEDMINEIREVLEDGKID